MFENDRDASSYEHEIDGLKAEMARLIATGKGAVVECDAGAVMGEVKRLLSDGGRLACGHPVACLVPTDDDEGDEEGSCACRWCEEIADFRDREKRLVDALEESKRHCPIVNVTGGTCAIQCPAIFQVNVTGQGQAVFSQPSSPKFTIEPTVR